MEYMLQLQLSNGLNYFALLSRQYFVLLYTAVVSWTLLKQQDYRIEEESE